MFTFPKPLNTGLKIFLCNWRRGYPWGPILLLVEGSVPLRFMPGQDSWGRGRRRRVVSRGALTPRPGLETQTVHLTFLDLSSPPVTGNALSDSRFHLRPYPGVFPPTNPSYCRRPVAGGESEAALPRSLVRLALAVSSCKGPRKGNRRVTPFGDWKSFNPKEQTLDSSGRSW